MSHGSSTGSRSTASSSGAPIRPIAVFAPSRLTPKGVQVREQVEAMIYEAPASIAALSATDLETLCRVLRKAAPEDTTRFASVRF